MGLKRILTNEAKDLANKAIAEPIRGLVDENLKEIVTTIGSFVVRSVRGRFQRSISFTTGVYYSDSWMEEALYGILYKYNNIKGMSRLELRNSKNSSDGSGMYYQLDDGTHTLKYRDYDILLAIQTSIPSSALTTGRVKPQKIYTIITYNLSDEFVKSFEKDMIAHRNSILRIKKDSPIVSVYQDYHEGDGYTYWEKVHTVPKRKLATVYLPIEQKRRIVNTINEFFASKEYYRRHGITHNLKILLYGPPGPQPVSEVIPTPNGPKAIGDLKPNDPVFAACGEITEVEEIYDYEEDDVYVVEFDDGRETRCSIEHKFPVVMDINGDSIVVDMTLKEIIDVHEAGYPVAIANNGAASYAFIPCKADPWAIGYISTAGFFTDRSVLMVEGEQNILEEVATRMNWNIEYWDIQYPYRFKSDLIASYKDSNGTEIDETYLKNLIPSIRFKHYTDAVEFKTAIIDNIPDEFMYNSIDVRTLFLQGVMDYRGLWSGGMYKLRLASGCYISEVGNFVQMPVLPNMSESMMYDVERLIHSLGIPMFRYVADDNIYFKPIPNGMFNLFLHSTLRYVLYNKSAELNNSNIPLNTMITDIRKEGREEFRCLHIAHDSHQYLTTDYIVTCNSGKDSIAKMIASEWNRNMYYVTGGKDGKFIPNAIIDESEDVNSPLMLISDIDKYPYIINDVETEKDAPAGTKDDSVRQKQMFGSMINALDGVLSGEDRIIVMTTNHIEKFSEVFLRDGRVDLKEEIGYVTPEVFRKYCHDFYHYDLPENIELADKELTIAKLQTDVVFRKLSCEEFIDKHVAKASKK